MKYLDRLLQTWRIRKAARYLKPGNYVLDIGTADGALFDHLPNIRGIGIDVNPASEKFPANALFFQGYFPNAIKKFPKKQRQFDAIVLLAVMEHIPETEQHSLVAEIAKHLKSSGTVILTIPSPLVDHIIHFLKFLRLIDGMEEGQHYGFKPQQTIPLFEQNGFKLVKHQRFQLGLNNLFVFAKD